MRTARRNQAERARGDPRREAALAKLGHGERRQRPVAWKIGAKQSRAWPQARLVQGQRPQPGG